MLKNARPFTASEAHAAAAKIRELCASKTMSYGQIAEALNKQGVPHPNGPWTQNRVNTFAYHRLKWRRAKSKTSSKRSAKAVPNAALQKDRNDDVLDLAELVMAAEIGRQRKRELLRSLFAGSTS